MGTTVLIVLPLGTELARSFVTNEKVIYDAEYLVIDDDASMRKRWICI